MKLKHYFKRFDSQVREGREELEDVICKTLTSKIMNCLGTNYPAKKLPKPSMKSYEISKLLLGQVPPVTYLPYILQNLGARPNDYMKFYYLDSLTNQLYIDALINMVCNCYIRGVQFIFDFSLANFTQLTTSPAIYVEYQIYDNSEYAITSIIYHCPFNGEMELEDFQSILLDSLYILNPEKCFQYLTMKLAAGITTIPYSQGKEISIIPCNGGHYSPLAPYRGIACNYRDNQELEGFVSSSPVIFKMVDSNKAAFKHNPDCIMDVSQLLSLLG